MKTLWNRIRQHLIDDWHQAWKWASIWFASLLLLVDFLAQELPAVSSYLPEHWVRYIALAILVGRVWKQKQKKQSEVTSMTSVTGQVTLTESQLQHISSYLKNTTPKA